MAGFSVDIGSLWQLAQTVNTQANDTAAVADLPDMVSDNPVVDEALAQLNRSWGLQASVLAEVTESLAMSLGGSAVSYLQTDEGAAKGFQP